MELQELIKVTKDSKIGYFEKDGTEVFPAIYDSIEEMEDDNFLLMEKDEKFTIYNIDHQILGENWYDEIEEFDEDEEGYYAKVHLDGKVGMIDSSGIEFVPCIYEEIDDYFDEDGLALVKRNGLYGKINRDGDEVITAMFDEIE